MEIRQVATLISGGASGLGEATARRLAPLGAKITLLDRDIARARIVAEEIGGIAVACDVTDEKSIIEALSAAQQAHGIAKICINCAGIVQAKRMIGETAHHR